MGGDPTDTPPTTLVNVGEMTTTTVAWVRPEAVPSIPSSALAPPPEQYSPASTVHATIAPSAPPVSSRIYAGLALGGSIFSGAHAGVGAGGAVDRRSRGDDDFAPEDDGDTLWSSSPVGGGEAVNPHPHPDLHPHPHPRPTPHSNAALNNGASEGRGERWHMETGEVDLEMGSGSEGEEDVVDYPDDSFREGEG